jgi:hypothetical protein
LHFWAHPRDVSGEQLHLSGALRAGEPPSIGNTQYGKLDGRLGVSGSTMSMVVERKDLSEPLAGTIDGSFSFDAQVWHTIRGTPDRGCAHIDPLNPSGGEPVYD